MHLSNKNRFLVLISVWIIAIKCFVSSMPKGQEKDTKNRALLSQTDLSFNYETLWRNAVTRDTIVSDQRTQNQNQDQKYATINNGQEFNKIPIDDQIMSRPIGTYQYIDADGHLHIVNYINHPNGLKILNDYKPFERLVSKNKQKIIESNDPKNNNKFSNENHSEEESHKDINYEEFEFTFLPQEINKSIDKTNNKINDLNSNESNKDLDSLSANSQTNKLAQNNNNDNNNNNEKIYQIRQLINSMPLPQPFSLPNHSEPPFSRQQTSEQANSNWRGPPIHNLPSYSMPVQGSPTYFDSQFQTTFNWNQNYQNY